MAISSFEKPYTGRKTYPPGLSSQKAGSLRRKLALGVNQLESAISKNRSQVTSKFSLLKQEVVKNLSAQELLVNGDDGNIQLNIIHQFPHTVDLLELCHSLPLAEEVQVVLGRDQDGRSMVYDLAGDNMGNILISGESTAGKSTLMRSMAVSLALLNRQSQVQLAIVSMPSRHLGPFKRPDLITPLTYLPHTLFPVVTNVDEAFEVLQFVTDEVTYREEMGLNWPLLVVFIDNVDRLLESGNFGITSLLTRLAQVSPAVGLRLVLSAANPDNGDLRRILGHNVSLHLTGRTNLSPFYGRTPASNQLSGQGDFLARSYGVPRRFQAAFMDDYELRMVFDDLSSQE